MERDTGFRSWFQRAIQLSPSLRQADTETEESVDDDVDVDDDRFSEMIEGARPKTIGVHSKLTSEVNHWSLLLKDNVRFWDCLAMLRTDPGLSCHSAIYLVTQSPDSEYFSEDLRASYTKYFKDEEELEIEVLRLTVENRKLHAVLWVLADNPHFRVDSVVAAIFRLNETQFDEKFHFVYQPGCFSGKSPVLGPGPKVVDQGGASIALHTKRCRSSTPVRTCRPLHHVSERLCHSVTRSSTYRRGKNISSNKSKCPIHKYEPPRKRRSDWMKSAFLTGLDNKSSNNILSKLFETDNHDKDENHNDEDDVEEEEEEEDDVGGVGGKNSGGLGNREDYDDQVDNDADDNLYDRCFESNDSLTMRSDSASRRGLSRVNTIRSVTRGTRTSKSFNDKSMWTNAKQYSNNNNNTFLQYIDNSIHNSLKRNKDLFKNQDGSEQSTVSENPERPIIRDGSNSKKSSYTRKIYIPRKPTISLTSFGSTVSKSTRYSSLKNNVQFDSSLPTAEKPTPMITYSETPRQAEKISTPYLISIDETPADFIHSQNQKMETMVEKQRKIDIRFCPKLKTKGSWQKVPFKGVQDIRFEKTSKSLITQDCMTSIDLKADSDPCVYKRSSDVIVNSKTSEIKNNVTDHFPSNYRFGSESLKGNLNDDKDAIASSHYVQRQNSSQMSFPNWITSYDRCKCLKKTLRKMGPRQYTKPLLTMINRSCSGNIQPRA